MAHAFTSVAEIIWTEKKREVELILSEGSDHLVGVGLLRDTRLKIDYINQVLEIEKP